MRSSLSHHTVLLITDDPHLQRLATWILVEAGFYASFVETVFDALDKLGSLQPDVIVLDVSLDEPSQRDVPRLRQAFPTVRLVGLHSQADGSSRHIDSECHLHKPFSADELVECIHDALAASVGAQSAHRH